MKRFILYSFLFVLSIFSGIHAYPVYATPLNSPTLQVVSGRVAFLDNSFFDDLNLLKNGNKQAIGASAVFRRAASLQQKLKDSYRANEVISFSLNNPDNDPLRASFVGANNEVTPINLKQTTTDGVTTISVNPMKQMKPGKYKILVVGLAGNKIEQDFTWGVLAINTNKSIYAPHEKAHIEMAVLDENGGMVCNAEVTLSILKTGAQQADVLTTKNKDIVINKQCYTHDFTIEPDYETTYQTGEAGEYTMTLTAVTGKGTYTITDTFEVQESVPFDVERVTTTRIYPPLTYPVKLQIKANRDFDGIVKESVPESFTVTSFASNSAITDKILAAHEADTANAQGSDALKPSSSPTLTTDKPPLIVNATKESTAAAEITIPPLEVTPPPPSTPSASRGLPLLRYPFNGNYPKTQGFGPMPDDEFLSLKYKQYGVVGHDGMDFGLPWGTPVVAADSGIVLYASPGDYGNTIIIQHNWGRTYYGHLSSFEVHIGQPVVAGQELGLSGNTGLSSGPHLHFGVRPNTFDSSNGYYGKVDPSIYFIGVAQRTVLGEQIADPDFASPPQKGVHEISIPLHIKKGETVTLEYQYQAPQVSPQFYLIGPLTFVNDDKNIAFTEARKWQIASDAVWYNSSWNYRKTITIDHTKVPNTDQTNFPVAISISGDSNLSSNARSDGFDILFTSSDGNTKLSSDREKYSKADATWCNTSSPVVCNGSWTKRKKITINNSASSTDLTNFPLLVKLSGSNFTFANARSDGFDVVFTDSNGNALNYEREAYDGSSTGIFWVNVPTLHASSSTDYIYMYYSNPSASDQVTTSVMNNTWDTDMMSVWHLKETSGTHVDSTIKGHASTAVNVTTQGSATGQIAGADQFVRASSNIITMSSNSDYNIGANNATWEVWASLATLPASIPSPGKSMGLIEKTNGSSSSNGYWFVIHNANEMQLTYAAKDFLSTALSWNTGQFYHLVAVKNGTTVSFYRDGTFVSSQTQAGTMTDSASALQIGCECSSFHVLYTNEYFDGIIDEVRITNDALSADRVKADYLTQTDAMNSFGTEETYDGGSYIAWVKVPTLSHTTNTVIYMYYGNASSCDQTLSSCDGTNNSKAVWSSYGGVYHMNQDPTGGVENDSTANALNLGNWPGTPFSSGNLVSGMLYNSIIVGDNATSNLVMYHAENAALHTTGDMTIQGWMNTSDTSTNDKDIVYKNLTASPWQNYHLYDIGSANLFQFVWCNTSTCDQPTGATTVNANTWYYVAGVRSGTTDIIYVNGNQDGTSTFSGSGANTNESDFLVGSIYDIVPPKTLDEIRYRSSAISADWVKTEYNNQSNPSTFYSLGTQDCYPGNYPVMSYIMRHGKYFDVCGKHAFVF